MSMSMPSCYPNHFWFNSWKYFGFRTFLLRKCNLVIQNVKKFGDISIISRRLFLLIFHLQFKKKFFIDCNHNSKCKVNSEWINRKMNCAFRVPNKKLSSVWIPLGSCSERNKKKPSDRIYNISTIHVSYMTILN